MCLTREHSAVLYRYHWHADDQAVCGVRNLVSSWYRLREFFFSYRNSILLRLEGRKFYRCTMFSPNLQFPTQASGPRQKYIRGWILSCSLKWHLDISPSFPLFLQGMKKSEIWRQFSTPFVLESLWFLKGATHRKSEAFIRALMTDLCTPKCGGVLSTHLRQLCDLQNRHLKNRLRNLLSHQ